MTLSIQLLKFAPHSSSGGDHFQATNISTSTFWPMQINRHVTKFASQMLSTSIYLSIDDDTGADTIAYIEIDELLNVFSRPYFLLSNPLCSNIIDERDMAWEVLLHYLCQRHIAQTEQRGEENHPVVLIDLT